MHSPFFKGAFSTGFGSVIATIFKVACSWAYSQAGQISQEKGIACFCPG
jgi:hypothetical protein